MTTIRPAVDAEMAAVADLWHEGWHDGHAGHVPDGLTAARTLEAFHQRTPSRVADTSVAVSDSGELLGFVMVVDDEVEQVLEEWESCLAEVGLRRDQSRSPWAVAGTTTDPTEANIRTALLDLDCKDRVDYVARIAAVEAAVQAPIVQEHLAELQQMRAEYDAMLADARAYLGENAPG